MTIKNTHAGDDESEESELPEEERFPTRKKIAYAKTKAAIKKEIRSRSASKQNSRTGSRRGSIVQIRGDSDYDEDDELEFQRIAKKGRKLRQKMLASNEEEDE